MVSDVRLAAQLEEIDQLQAILNTLRYVESPEKVADCQTRLDELRGAVEHALYARLDAELADLGDDHE